MAAPSNEIDRCHNEVRRWLLSQAIGQQGRYHRSWRIAGVQRKRQAGDAARVSHKGAPSRNHGRYMERGVCESQRQAQGRKHSQQSSRSGAGRQSGSKRGASVNAQTLGSCN